MVKGLFSLFSLRKIYKYILTHKKRSLVLGVILIILIFTLIPRNGPNVLTEKVERKNISKTVSVTGDVSANNTVNLTFQTGETLAWVGVNEGDTVVAGQAIASINQTRLQATLRQAQQDFVAAQAASQQYYDDHNNDTESDSEKVQRTAIDAAQNKAYDQLLKVQYDIAHSTIYSPINGIVTRIDARTPGVNVTPSTTFSVTDPTSLYFKMEVDEADIGKVFAGQKVNISFDAFPETNVQLDIDKIDFVSHKTSSGGNAFYVNAPISKFENYRVGMSGNADIIIDEKKDVISIPLSSIFDDNYVYIEKNGKFEKRKVSLGLQSDTDSEVISGLSEGEYVVLDPTSIPQNKIK